MTAIRIIRAGPLTTLQDDGRPGWLALGISASGPMDRRAFARAAGWLGGAGSTGIEFTSGLALVAEEGPLGVAADGGDYRLKVNGTAYEWPARVLLKTGDQLEIGPGARGNYGYLRFDAEIDVAAVLGSRATNSIAGLGGRVLAAGDRLALAGAVRRGMSAHPRPAEPVEGPIRVIWGLHAEHFPNATRQRFVTDGLVVSARMDRMGVRLEDRGGMFATPPVLSLVSDAIVPGDIQILGDGTPIVLMRDHQPTGGYPRIATVISADLDRFAQLRPGAAVRFQSVTVAHAQGVAT